MHYLTFAGKSSHDFGIRISGEGTFNRPKRKYKEYEVTGRNGTLLIDENSFENISVTYPSYMIEDMPDKVEAFANYMSSFAGYQRLEDTYAPDVFRLAQYSDGLDVKSSGYMNRHGEMDVIFNCKPQRFIKSGELPITFTSNGTLYNETQYAAEPLIRVYGNGNGSVGIGSYLITITNLDVYMDIDCALMDAFKGTLNCNNKVSFNADNIAINSGQNGITFTGGITSVVITPRWWIL